MPLVILIVWLVFGTIFAIIGSKMARARGRDPVIWGFVCFFFCLLGIIVLAIAGRAQPGVSGSQQVVGNLQKWQVLVELDADIRAAAEAARAAGPRYEIALAQKYLTLNDKSYLQAALQAVLSQAEVDSKSQPVEPTDAIVSNTQSPSLFRQLGPLISATSEKAPLIGVFLVLSACALIQDISGYFSYFRGAGYFGLDAFFYPMVVVLNAIPLLYSGLVGYRNATRQNLLSNVALGSAIFSGVYPIWLLIFAIVAYGGFVNLDRLAIYAIVTGICTVAAHVAVAALASWFARRKISVA